MVPFAIFLLVVLALFGIGATLLIRGKWPKRVGNTPHCRKCDYIVSGDQTRCPECGTVLNAGTVVYGDHRRRQGFLWAGRILCSIGGFFAAMGLIGFVSNHDWTPYKPLSWLLRDMGTGPSPAWQEISRRLEVGKLSESDKNAIVEKGMPKQKVTNFWALSTVHEFVAQRYAEGKLTAEQEEQYAANMLSLSLKMRPIVGMKGNTPYKIDFTGYIGPGNWRSRYRPVEWRFDDQPAQKFTRPDQTTFSQYSTRNFLPAIGSPGRHQFHIKVEVETGFNALFDVPQASPVKRRVYDLSASFDAVDGDGPVATVTSPSAEEMKKHIKPTITFNPAVANTVQLQLQMDSLPVDVSFDVFFRYGGAEYKGGIVTLTSPSTTRMYGGAVTRDRNPPPSVDVILRSSEAYVRENVDIMRIWKGEIVFTNVPVTRVNK